MRKCLTIAATCYIIELLINHLGGDFMVIPDVNALKTCRAKQGLSARALALKASLNVSTIASIEKTGHAVAPSTAKAVCDVLNVPFETLFTVKTEDKKGGCQQ